MKWVLIAGALALCMPLSALEYQASSDVRSVKQINDKQSQRLDLNHATFEQLIELKGIGKAKAMAILQYRQNVGRFESVEQLLQVKGIGAKALNKIKPLVKV